MDREVFSAQIERLRNQWPNSYGEERTLILWKVFKSVQDFEFADAISECIGNYRAAPMVKEIEAEVNLAHTRTEQQRATNNLSMIQIMENAAGKSENKELANMCCRVVREKIDGRLTKDQFWNEVMPMIEKVAVVRR